MKIIELVPPRVSIEHVKEKITCIRAHRERMFALSIEFIDNKLVCHNYGQGGAGWTFLFGCVTQSIKLFEQYLLEIPAFKNKPIVVIGAGCYGLLTAALLADKGYSVRIVAKETEHMASYKAAGFFFPRPRKCSTPEEIATFKNLGVASYTTYLEIINGTHSFIKTGVQLLPAYYDPAIDPGFGPYIQDGLLQPPREIIIDFNNGKQYNALEYKTIFINSVALMHELHAHIKKLGVIILKKEIQAFEELDENIIFNCSGLGSKKLTQDKRLLPVQGHLITLKDQPDSQQLQYMINFKAVMAERTNRGRDELIYYAPKESGILGITFIRGQDSLTVNQHEFDRLLERCENFFGS